MENHKVISSKDGDDFVVTSSFFELRSRFKELEYSKGRIVLVTGSPGTGKSANIYCALTNLNLNKYEPVLFIDDVEKSYKNVFSSVLDNIKEDLNFETENEMYHAFSMFDMVLVADKFLDSEFLNPDKVGLALWVENKGIKSFPFFFLWMIQYLLHLKDLKKINLVFQTAWTVKIRGIKYDLITDFSVLSKLLSWVLKLLFEVVEITYSTEETRKIVRNYYNNMDDERIRFYIKKYGNRPRYILDALENENIKCPE